MKPNLKPLALAILCASFSNAASSADSTWLGPLLASGCTADFSDATCWQGGIPDGPFDTAIFQANPIPNVNFSGDVRSENSTIAGTYLWDMDGHTYRIANGFTLLDNAYLLVKGGGSISAHSFSFGSGSTPIYSTITINGRIDLDEGSALHTGNINYNNAGTSHVTFGNVYTDTLDITSSHSLISKDARIGDRSITSALGQMRVARSAQLSGNNTTWSTETLTLSQFNTLLSFEDDTNALVTVSGLLSVSDSAIIRAEFGGRIKAGNIHLENRGKIFSNVGMVGADTTAIASAVSSGDATISEAFWSTNTLTVTNNRTLTIVDNGLAQVDATLNISNNGKVNIRPDSSNTNAGEVSATDITILSGGILSNNNSYVGSNTIVNRNMAAASNSVTVSGSGSKWLTDNLTVLNGGQLNANDSGLVDVAGFLKINSGGSVIANTGQIRAESIVSESGGQLISNSLSVGQISTANGSVSAISGAKVTGADSQWLIGEVEITNGKTLSVEDSAVVIAQNIDVNNGGHLVVNNAGIAVGNTIFSLGSGDINISDDAGTPASTASSLDLTDGEISANVNITNANLNGTGIITGDVTGVGANIGPGNSPGLLSIGGDFSVDSNSSILFELGGLIAESQYDVINVTGTADLAGELVVDLFDLGDGLFDVSDGDFFDILTAETITGSFDLLTLALLDPSLQWELNYLTDFQGSTDVLRLSAVSAVPVPAAAWLFGSGLLGLVGVARRKTV